MNAALPPAAASGKSYPQAGFHPPAGHPACHTRASTSPIRPGDTVAGSFGTATAVAAAFNGFWSSRDDVGERLASLLFRKADAVAAASSAFVEADNEMTAAASAALAKLPADYAPHHRGDYRAVQ